MQNSLKEVVEEGQQYVGTESLSFEYLFSINMVFLQESVETYMYKASYVPWQGFVAIDWNIIQHV